MDWRALPRATQLFVAAVVVLGAFAFVTSFPTAYPRPLLFAGLVAAGCLTSLWKVNLPLSLASGSTLSVSHAADLMALLLLGPGHAMIVAMSGAWTQCTFNVKRHYPVYRTVFSLSAKAVTIAITGLAYDWLGGTQGSFELSLLPMALVGAIAAYFVVDTGLVAGAVASSTSQPLLKVWRDDFLWSGVNFMVAGIAGATAAVIIDFAQQWTAVLMLAPVYLTYRTYQLFVGRLEDQRRHVAETRSLHQEAVDALLQARHAERALMEEKERLAVTLRSIGDGVVTTDLRGSIVSMNSVAETMTGWTQEEALGKPIEDVVRTLDLETKERCESSVARLVAKRDPLNGARRSTMLVGQDLTERPIEEITAPIRNADGRTMGFVLAFRDLTDALRIQEERAKAGRLASLGLLAGGMAHDFNNILVAVMGNISMARATMPRTGSSENWLGEAERACVRAKQLTWQLLTFSKGGVPARKTLAVGHVLQEAVGLAFHGSGASCTIDIAPDLWSVNADATQLIQVFSNVIVNAQQAMAHNGVLSIRAENVVEVEGRWENALRVEPGCYVRISVADKGLGIPKEHLGRIFDPYFSTKQGGTGLGLATTYSIVKTHGGFLAVDSQLGHGTTMRISFPAAGSRDVPDQIAQPVTRADPRKPRVLVMDDEATTRTVTMSMLEFLGYEAEVAANRSTALEYFRQALATNRPFDVVMLDLIMPGDIGGAEAVNQLGGLDPTVKAILMSGFAQESVVTEFEAYGFKAVITKPFTLQELDATLHSVIGVSASTPRPGSWRVH